MVPNRLLVSSVLALCVGLMPTASLAQDSGVAASMGMTDAGAQDAISGIEISGNERIEPATVRSYIGLREGDSFAQANIDRGLKGLFGTGLFADVSLSRRGTVLIVRVKENPIINQIAFEGNKKLEDKALLAEIQSKTRAVYTRTRVQSDLQRVLDLYRRSGYFAATVTPKIIPLDQNRVDLVFEVNEGARTYVKSIKFVGNSKFTDGQLSDEILTRRERWYRFFSANDVYDPDRLEVDKELLRRYYLSQGYADFRVVSAVAELSPDNEGFYLTFTVEEGERYKFGNVDVQSNFKDMNVDLLKKKILSKSGEWYDASQVEASVSALTSTLNDMQYAFVDVRPEVQRDRDAHVVNLTYNVSEGPRVFVERININGNLRTQDKVIRRELLLSEGDPFNRSKLNDSEQRIRDLGYFEKVDVKVDEGTAPDQAVVNVTVAEQSTGEVSLGAGYSTTDGVLADFGISERNFLGKGQDLRFNTTLSGKSQEFNFSFTEPYFMERDLSAGVDAFHETRQYDESSYDQQNTGFSLRMGYPLGENLRQKVSYTLKNTRIDNVPATSSRYIREQEGERLTSMLGQELVYDRRNSKLDPTDGYVLRLNTDVAGLGGDAEYVRAKTGGIGYVSLFSPEWVLSGLAETGGVWGFGGEDVAISDRFFLGGNSLRGFKTSGIGPRDLTTSSEDSLGGRYFARTSLEMTFPTGLPEEMGVKAHVFSDAGTVWDSGATPLPGETFIDSQSIRVSTGAGLSWRSPLGPLRVDFAFPIVKEDEDQTQQFHLSFGTRF